MSGINAELGILGAALGTNGLCLDELTITGDAFEDPRYGDIFDAALGLRRKGRGVDLITLSDAAPAHAALIPGLLEWSPMAYNVGQYVEIVEHASVRRRLAVAGAQIASLDPELAAAELVDRAQAIVGAVTTGSQSKFQWVRDIIPGVLERLEADETFIPSPWRGLNEAIGGFRPGAVYVVAARPGVGKTVIAAQIAVALAEKGAVAFSSLEMSAAELVQRFISERAQVPVGKIKNNDMTEYEYGKIANKREALDALNIAIDDRTNIAASDVRTFARGLARKHEVSGIVVDYLQLMSSNTKAERYAQVTEFSRQMKVMAKDLDVPVIVLSQLNRASESRPDGIPKISDLRESGAIEQDADVVMLLRREGEQPDEQLIIDVAKNRHGDTVEVVLDWQGYYSRAVSLT